MLQKNKKTYEELERENNLLQTIIDTVSDGVYSVDREGKILIYNKSFERMEGTKRANMLGKKDMDVYQHQCKRIFCASQFKKIKNLY